MPKFYYNHLIIKRRIP